MTNLELKQIIKEYNIKYRNIKDQIYDCYSYLEVLQKYRNNESINKKIEYLDKKMKILKEEKNSILEKIDFYQEQYDKTNSKIIASDEEIELGVSDSNNEGYFDIWLKKNNHSIGFISYSKDLEFETGNIAYEIDSDYQGNNYAYKALKLLSNYLKEQGVNDISLSIRQNNIPSIRTAEKFMGDALNTKIKRNKGLYKNLSMYYFKIGEDE